MTPGKRGSSPDLQSYVERAAADGKLVVQPRMGISDPGEMAAGLRAVAGADARTAGTITVDSYTRVEDIAGAGEALANGEPLNGYPIVNHGTGTTRWVAAHAGDRMPVQVRHGSARPGHVFAAMSRAGLAASEGGPVSYCLPYSRLPLSDSVPAWRDAAFQLAEESAALGLRAHLETFGGCMLGQLCPPSLLLTLSVLEAMFFVQCGLTSVSLSYTQQTHPVQDIEALAALRQLANEYLPPHVAWHIVLYTYMGVYPGTEAGAGLLLDRSAQVAVRGGAGRLIVKTSAEAHRIPTVAENVAALERADRAARYAGRDECPLPWHGRVDFGDIYAEASILLMEVLTRSGDIGTGLREAFRDGALDVPFCLHRDNAGTARSTIDDQGRLGWARTGGMPLPGPAASVPPVTSASLLTMLGRTARLHDEAAELAPGTGPFRVAVVGSGPRGLAVIERLAARVSSGNPGRDVEITVIDKVQVGCGRIWRSDQDGTYLMNTPSAEVTMFSGPPDGPPGGPTDGGPARAGAGPSLGQWLEGGGAGEPVSPGAFAPRAVYGWYLRFYLDAAEASLPAGSALRRVTGEVTAVEPDTAGWRLSLAGGETIRADRVVLATGHPATELPESQAALSAFGAARASASYIRGDCAADMPLDAIAPGTRVGVIGMGLTFYDVMAALTTARGGRFVAGAGGLRYVPSGREPVLIAGSRSGVPMPARGLNQKEPGWRYRPRLFTRDLREGPGAGRSFRRGPVRSPEPAPAGREPPGPPVYRGPVRGQRGLRVRAPPPPGRGHRRSGTGQPARPAQGGPGRDP